MREGGAITAYRRALALVDDDAERRLFGRRLTGLGGTAEDSSPMTSFVQDQALD